MINHFPLQLKTRLQKPEIIRRYNKLVDAHNAVQSDIDGMTGTMKKMRANIIARS